MTSFLNYRVVAPLLLFLVLPSHAKAQRSLEIEDFRVSVEVNENAEITVQEAITVRFNGSWNGLYRTIPVEYRDPRGFSYRLFLDLEDVRDDRGQRLRTEVSRERFNRKIKMWVPGAQDVSRTITLRYSVPNALKFFEDHDEFYWNVTGTEWEIPIRRASAIVELPEGATGLRATAFTGAYGSAAQDARIEELEHGFYFETTRGLNFREGLTVVIGWDPGAVRRPGILRQAGLFLRSNWLLFLPLISFFGMFLVWKTWGKDPARRSISPQYEPPEGMTPAEVGTLVDNRPDTRDVTATLVDLAVRGHLRIEEMETKQLFGLIKDSDYRFVRLTEENEWEVLKSHERILLRGIFGLSGSVREVYLSDLKNEFYQTMTMIKADIFQGLKGKRFYRHRPDKVLGSFIAIGVVSIGLAVAGFQVLAGIFLTSPLSAAVAGVLFGLPILGFGILMPARTVSGTRMLERILGFQEFLNRVEADRFRRMIKSPQTFEAFLPFAMALGVEEKWAKAFEDIYTEPPQWYVGRHPHAFRTGLFVNDLSMMTTQAGSVMVSQPRSTGGSGFGGGGFSGG
ncbi:MAG: DUF2207 domain-containing protein, partial [Gemmatimonadetes bacterium]|nr:DUF2207 domain-containing protein [Gemmatimonadota bacterium]